MVSDLTDAMRFLESQTATYHTGRMKTLLLEREQNKPTAYSDDGAFFVVSRLNTGVAEEKQKVTTTQFLDISTRQVFHEYEKLNLPTIGNNLTGTPGKIGVSPAKSNQSVLQVAAAHQLWENEKNPKASPAGHLCRQLNTDLITMTKKNRLRPHYNTHSFNKDTPKGYCCCVSKTEKQYASKNFTAIEKFRERENTKQKIRAIETNHDT